MFMFQKNNRVTYCRFVVSKVWIRVSSWSRRQRRHSFMHSSPPRSAPTSQMWLCCRRKEEEKTWLLSCSQSLGDVYCSTRGCSQHSRVFVTRLPAHLSLCRRVFTGAWTTTTKLFHTVWLWPPHEAFYAPLLCKQTHLHVQTPDQPLETNIRTILKISGGM